MKRKFLALFVLVWLFGGIITGFASALTVYKVELEYSDWGWQNYTRLIEPDDTCEECAVFAPLDDLVDNGDGTGNTTIYVNGEPQVATVYFNETTGYPKLVTGKIGNAFEFDGNSGEGVSVTIANDLFVNKSFAIAVWFNFTGTNSTTEHIIFSRYFDSLKGYIIGQYVKFRFIDKDSNSFILTVPEQIQLSRWYLAVFYYDYSAGILGIKLYDDSGVLIGTVEQDIGTRELMQDANGKLLIGSRTTGTDGRIFAGKIDELRVYLHRIPTDEEIQVILNLGRYKLPLWQGNEADLPAYLNATLFCPLDELDTVNNVTKCYLNKEEVNATINFDENGFPKLVSGIGNAFHFNASNSSYIEFNEFLIDNTSFTITFRFRKTDDTGVTLIDKYVSSTNSGLNVYATGTQLKVTVGNGTTTEYVTASIELNKDYFVAIRYSNNYGLQLLLNGQIVAQGNYIRELALNDPNQAYWIVGRGYRGDTSENGGFVIDELRFYSRAVSDDELNIIYHLSRHKTATLSAPSASYDGSQFLVNITSQLPADSGSYILPAPIGAQASYASVGTIGNFTFLDVGTEASANFVLPAVPGQAVPGLKYLGIETDEGPYVYGTYTLTLVNPTIKLLYNNNVKPTNIVSAGKVTAVSYTSSTLQKLSESPFELVSGDGQLQFKQFSLEDSIIDALSVTNPIKLNAYLLPLTTYKVAQDLNVKYTLDSNTEGLITFTIDGIGAWEIFKESLGSSIALGYIMRLMITLIIVAVMAAMVYERTPTPIDDTAVKAILYLIVSVVLIALVKLLLLTK